MAIRFEYSPGATGGLAAYAAGRGRAQERRSKYLTDLLQAQQERRDRFNLIGQQQQFAADMEWRRAVARQAESFRRDEATERRLKYADTLARTRADEVAKAEEPIEFRRSATATAARLKVPSWVSPGDMAKLEKKKAEAEAFLKPDMDFGDPAVRKGFSTSVDDFNAYLSGLSPPSAAEEFKRGIVYADPVGGDFYDAPGPGRIPFDAEKRQPLFDEPREKPDEEYRAKVTKIADQLSKEVDETSGKPTYTREEALDAAAKQVATDEAFFAPPKQPTAAAQPAQTRPAGFDDFLNSLQPQQLAMPRQPTSAPLPPGAIQLPDGTVEYNGQIYRRRTQ